MVSFEVGDASLFVIRLTTGEPPLAGARAEDAFGYAIESGHDSQITPFTRMVTKSLVIFGLLSANRCNLWKKKRGFGQL